MKDTAPLLEKVDPGGIPLEESPIIGSINILLVDDEPKNLAALETVLDDPSYRLVRAGSADEALLALVAEDFALLVLDIQMPDMNGFELAQLIKKRKKNAAIPIIFLTAFYSEDQHVLEGYSSGAVDYLHKPINAAILRSKVAVFAALYCKTRENAYANRALQGQIAERQRAQQELHTLNVELEERVSARTVELGLSEARLREADKRKDEFLAMLGHELRNPLAAIRHAIRIGAESPEDVAAQKWAHEVIDRQSAQLARMVDDLLDVERINRGRIELRPEVFDVGLVLAAAIEGVRPLLDEKNHAFALEAEPGLFVKADMARLQQVFVNLLGNAAKYTRQGGVIRASIQRLASCAQISIADNGIGLSSEMLPQVFGLFTQVDTSLDRAEGGLGIGLTVSKSLVEMHGGTITAESDGTDCGSTFSVRLPLVDPPHSSAAEIELADEKTTLMPIAQGDGILPSAVRILVVDDHRDAGETLSRLLTRRGCEVRTAYDGLAALAVAREFQPQVLLLDLGLPGLDGYELCRTLRGELGFAKARFIATSGYALQSDVARSLAAGFDLHFAKPVDFSILLRAVLEPLPAS